jgi:hypothetical protein
MIASVIISMKIMAKRSLVKIPKISQLQLRSQLCPQFRIQFANCCLQSSIQMHQWARFSAQCNSAIAEIELQFQAHRPVGGGTHGNPAAAQVWRSRYCRIAGRYKNRPHSLTYCQQDKCSWSLLLLGALVIQ